VLEKAYALVNQALTESADRQIKIRAEFDRITSKIDEKRTGNGNFGMETARARFGINRGI
jgi:hypothetical protein